MGLHIAHLTFSASGGAGTVASRLAQAQRRLGHEATVVSAIDGSLRDTPMRKPLHTLAAATDDLVIRNPKFNAPISVLRDRLSIPLNEDVWRADILHIHWPHGLVQLEQLASIAGDRPVVWTLHDMAAFTGGCHYSLGCDRYMSGCPGCPATRTLFRRMPVDLLRRKSRLLGSLGNLTVVTPSHWLAGQAEQSQVFGSHRVRVIPNPLPPDFDASLESDESGPSEDSSEGPIFLVAAAHLNDPVKSTMDAVNAFTQAFPGGKGARLLLAGRGEIAARPGVEMLGHLSHEQLRDALRVSDYLLMASSAENQPLIISEAQASGVSLIGRNSTGIPEHLDIDTEGCVFDSVEALARQMRTLSKRSSKNRLRLASAAQKKFDPLAVAERNIATYHEALHS